MPAMNVDIRIAEEKDFPEVMQMIKEFADYLGKSNNVKTSVEDLIENQEYFVCLLAETEKGIAGYALLSYNFYTWTGKAIHLDDLYIKEKFRGNHIGSKLIHAIFDKARESKCKTVNWEVLSKNKNAIAFYKKLGATISDDKLNCSYSL
jgi:ribosomal protein S18 acetylase RimI-like enzyme